MIFKDFNELISNVDKDIGIDFCNKFQQKRKDLKQAGRVAGWNELFGNIHKDWAINKGGNTEIQYHIGLNLDDSEDMYIVYGLGFNAQYVPHQNAMSPQDMIRPFMSAFLNIKQNIAEQLPDYSFVIGSEDQLKNPQYDDYNLFGKGITVTEQDGSYSVIEDDYKTMLSDLKKQFDPYVQVFELKNKMSTMNETIISWANVLLKKGQIILQGPPGTGKTYSAQDIAYYLIFNKQLSSDVKSRKEELLILEANEQYQFVQFHPSFTYEDFVRGITAKPSSNSTGIIYQAEDKLFGNFAKQAYQNMLDSKKSIETISVEKWIKSKTYDYQAYLDEQLNANDGRQKLTEKVYIYKTDENGIRYKGDNWSIDSGVPFSDLVEMYKAKIKTRQDVKNLQTLSATAKWNSTYWLAIFNSFDEYVTSLNETPPVSEIIEEKKYVMVIDEINRANLPSVLGELIYALEYRDQTVKSMYELAIGGNDLLLPSNLHIIGTMNTADRSVGHIDYAIRRRFAFVPVLPNASIITYPLALTYFKEIGNLIEAHRAGDFEFNDIMLGHSYFLADNDAYLKLKLRYEVYPILKEYLKDGLLNKNDESEALLKVLYEKIESINE